MNLDKLLHSMLRDLWLDLQEPTIVWQVGVLAGCLLVAWLAERWLLGRWAIARTRADSSGSQAAVEVAKQAIGRVLGPLFALGLVALARPILGIWEKTNLLRVAIPLLIALVLVRAIVYAVSRLSRTRGLAAFERLLVLLVWVAVGLRITGYADDVVDFLEAVVFVFGKHRVSLWAIVSGTFWMVVTILFAIWGGGVLEAKLLASDAGDLGVRTVFARVLRALLLTVAVLFGMSLIGLDLTMLSVFGGALGVGIGLGLQRIASSYISGFVVLLERKIRIGDLVTIDKYTGVVREINTRFTVLSSGLGWQAIIPNEALLTGTVQNVSIDPLQRLTVALTVGYDCDVERVMETMAACAEAHPQVVREPKVAAFLRGFGADGFQVELAYYIDDPLNRRLGVESDVNRSIRRALSDAGVPLAPPKREIALLTPAPGTGGKPEEKR
jgi:small-conductance mechanosensitive channel